jgi:hypothetical protein
VHAQQTSSYVLGQVVTSCSVVLLDQGVASKLWPDRTFLGFYPIAYKLLEAFLPKGEPLKYEAA